VELTMKGLLSRGNLILAVSWAMAIGMFVVRAGKADGVGHGGGRAPQNHAPQQANVVAVEVAPGVKTPAIVADPAAAISRNDPVRPLP
jgi:hypothetical protein